MNAVPELTEELLSRVPGAGARLVRPGLGHTPARFEALAELGRTDLSLARIAEAHFDATAILSEAGHEPRAGALYGVWACDGPNSRLTAERGPDGAWRLEGTKQYCSGAPFLHAALVTAHHEGSVLLFDVSMRQPGIRVLQSSWETPAMNDTGTVPVKFEGVTIAPAYQIGSRDWYLQRPGFWHGAIGPAACWAGGALSLIDAAIGLNRHDPHCRAHLGALLAHAWSLRTWMIHAGQEIDADPSDMHAQARVRALKVRHLIERTCTEVLDRFGRATGPQLLAYDAHVARQHMALALYIRQCHAERDLEALSDASISRHAKRPWDA